MFRRLFGGSKFLKKMNTLMELYSCSHNAPSTYQQLLDLKPLIRTEGERALFELNRAALLYDMRQFREAADVVLEIRSLNPEFDAKCAVVKMKIIRHVRDRSNIQTDWNQAERSCIWRAD